jgi:hypothetical protein
MRKMAILLPLLLSCHSQIVTTVPDPPKYPDPPTFENAINLSGHRQKYCTPMYSQDDQIWYAYWSETTDSSHAILRVGISPSDEDSIFLVHTNSNSAYASPTDWWRYSPNAQDSILIWQYVLLSRDSVITGSHGTDCGTYYYLRKKN